MPKSPARVKNCRSSKTGRPLSLPFAAATLKKPCPPMARESGDSEGSTVPWAVLV